MKIKIIKDFLTYKAGQEIEVESVAGIADGFYEEIKSAKYKIYSRCDSDKLIFKGDDLTHANLTHADLTDANLTHANLTDANLTHANLTDANLTDANLTDANLTDANLTDANLTLFGGGIQNIQCLESHEFILYGKKYILKKCE